MADEVVKVSELTETTNINGLYALGVSAENESVKVPLDTVLGRYENAVTEAAQAKTDAAAAVTAASTAQVTSAEAKTSAQEALANSQTAQSNSKLAIFGGFLTMPVSIAQQSSIQEGTVMYSMAHRKFLLRVSATYYSHWRNSKGSNEQYNDPETGFALATRLFFYNGIMYLFDDVEYELNPIADIRPLQEQFDKFLAADLFCNVSEVFGIAQFDDLFDMIGQINERFMGDSELADRWRRAGVVMTFKTANRWEAYQWLGGAASQFINVNLWRRFGGSSINAYEESEWGENGENIDLIEGEFYGVLEDA